LSETVIVGMARTAFGRLGGALADVTAVDLGAAAVKGAVERSGLSPEQVDYVILGQVIQGGSGQMPARQAAIKAGIPLEVPSLLVNKVCISSISALVTADQIIKAGDAEVIVTGGMESMSQGCYYVPKGRFGYRMGNGKLIDGMIHDALWCAINDWHMGEGTDRVADEFGTTREHQDLWAARSQQRAAAAQEAGKFAEEIVGVEVKKKKDVVIVDKDEHIRPDTTVESLSKLPPAFRKEGTISAGNASGINDGAAAVVVASRKKAEELGLPVLGTVVSHGMVADKPEYLATVPANSTMRALEKIGKKVEDVDLFEMNEAFAAVCWHSSEMLGLDPETAENTNVNGGAIALGHPVGASGARIVAALVNELRRRGGGLGAASICGGGGQGDAVLIQVDV
jgi:acetyl-CoA C-acetyltransferase